MIERIEHGTELFNISPDELVLTVAPYQRKYKTDIFEQAVELPEEQQGFETSVFGSSQYFLDEGNDTSAGFEINLEHPSIGFEIYRDVVYSNLLDELENTYEDAEINAPEPYILDHFFITE